MTPAFSCAVLLALAAPATAQQARELCPARPGLGTPPCIVDAHRVLAEVGMADWERDQDAGTRSDTLELGELLLRYGLDRRSEIQIGWTAFGRVRTAEGSPATTTRGVGDVTLAYKRSLLNPDGHQFSVALQPFVTMPVGRAPIGAGTLGVGLLVPVSKDLMRGLQLQVTLEVNAAPDADRAGRHLAYGSVIGLDVDLGGSVAATIEFSAFRDEAAGEHASALLGALAFAWQPTENLQIDAGGGVGLNRASADLRLYVGLAKRF